RGGVVSDQTGRGVLSDADSACDSAAQSAAGRREGEGGQPDPKSPRRERDGDRSRARLRRHTF
ncbi:MAG: hypothetical protein ACE5EX_11340, partial [Phycisphaerae bacterium]